MVHAFNQRMVVGCLALLILTPSAVHAGLFCDCLFGKKKQQLPPYPVGQPVPVGTGYSAGYGSYPMAPQGKPAVTNGAPQPTASTNYGMYYGSQMPVIGQAGLGYTAPTPTGITAATMPPTVTYVPNFRSSNYRTPVTYYRPVMTTDPRTGAQVVTMAPCTGYEYQSRRVPTWGYSALYGSNVRPPVVPGPQALPTYTLPSGGVPLAGTPSSIPNPGSAIQPQPQYSSAYPPPQYSSAYPQPQTAPAAGYPTAPYPSSAAAANCNGNCPVPNAPGAGYAAPVTPTTPGLVAPPATSGGTIRTPAPTYGQRTTPPGGDSAPTPRTVLPPTQSPGSAPGVFPPAASPTPDAGDVPPTLPPSFGSNTSNSNFQERQRPQFQNIVRQPNDNENGRADQADRAQEPPSLSPIPVPDDFDTSPNWSPGLLKEGDMTALRAISPEENRVAGQSKKIQWASFQQDSPGASATTVRMRPVAPEVSEPVTPRPAPAWQDVTTPKSAAFAEPAVNHGSASRTETPSVRYDASGWQSAGK